MSNKNFNIFKFDENSHDLSSTNEIANVLLQSDNVKIERIVSKGYSSPKDFWYDQLEDEWVLVVQGFAKLTIEQDGQLSTIELYNGDNYFIPAHTKHRVETTSDNPECIWVCVFITK